MTNGLLNLFSEVEDYSNKLYEARQLLLDSLYADTFTYKEVNVYVENVSVVDNIIVISSCDEESALFNSSFTEPTTVYLTFEEFIEYCL